MNWQPDWTTLEMKNTVILYAWSSVVCANLIMIKEVHAVNYLNGWNPMNRQ
jgi:hypothetical protein